MRGLRRPFKPVVGDRPLVLAGGGLDSTTLLAWLARQQIGPVRALFFDYGQKARHEELWAIDHFCGLLHIPVTMVEFDLTQVARSLILNNTELAAGRETGNKLEGRNVIFVMVAATWAATNDCDAIYLGYHHQPVTAPFPDATFRAVEVMQQVLDVAYHARIRIRCPFAGMTRYDIVRLAAELDPDILESSHTCYENTRGGCGRCAKCRQRSVMITGLRQGKAGVLLPPNG